MDPEHTINVRAQRPSKLAPNQHASTGTTGVEIYSISKWHEDDRDKFLAQTNSDSENRNTLQLIQSLV